MDSTDILTDFPANLPAFNPRKWVQCKIKDPTKPGIASNAVDVWERLSTRPQK